MENKKLVKILRKDMSELEELIADVKSQGNFNPLEMDFIHTRAKGLMQLIQLLKVDDENGSVKPPLKNEKLQEIKEAVSEIQEEVTEKIQQHSGKAEPDEEPEAKEPDSSEIEEVKEKVADVVKGETADDAVGKPEDISEEVEPEKVADTKSLAEQPQKTKEQVEGEKPATTENKEEKEDDEMLEEEAERKDSRLGDSFLKGKSVNDLVTDQNKLEFKLSNRPVSNIKTAIGINDRFQYIRELFDGNPEKFAKTVNDLDSKQNMKEAVDYLRKNFRWRKSETSLKFVNLVKRRFQNE